jgi:phenol 2-monooxygenase
VSVLHTYVPERSKTAADLIAFDRELTQLFARREQFEGEFADYFVKSGRYMAGFTARYEDTVVTDMKDSHSDGATGVTVGMRFPSAQVIRFCDCKAVQLQSVLKSDGRWRVVVFAGDINQCEHKERLDKVTISLFSFQPFNAKNKKLAASLALTSRRFTSTTADPDSIIEPILVTSSKFLAIEQTSIPEYFSPANGKWKIKGTSSPFSSFLHTRHWTDNSRSP